MLDPARVFHDEFNRLAFSTAIFAGVNRMLSAMSTAIVRVTWAASPGLPIAEACSLCVSIDLPCEASSWLWLPLAYAALNESMATGKLAAINFIFIMVYLRDTAIKNLANLFTNVPRDHWVF